MNETKAKMHSILTVVNAHADVERFIRERSEVDVDPQVQMSLAEIRPVKATNRFEKYYRGKNATVQGAHCERDGVSLIALTLLAERRKPSGECLLHTAKPEGLRLAATKTQSKVSAITVVSATRGHRLLRESE